MAGKDRDLRWIDALDDETASSIVRIVNDVSKQDSTVGFDGELSDEQAAHFIADLRTRMKHGRTHVLLITSREGEPFGMLVLEQHGSPNNQHIGDVSKAMLVPDARHQGILLEGAKELGRHCRRIGVDVMTLDVRADAPAMGLWAFLGFQQYGRLPDYSRPSPGHPPVEGRFMYVSVTDFQARLEEISPR
ncbi:MAG: hypothetical protein KC501_01560 [Myxococcales bacterium]|nr:hypothetical protein [Myxococcales bacterium]